MKWIALACLIIGFALVRRAFKLDRKANFDDGSFLGAIILALAGVALVASGALLFLIAVFLAI